MVAKKIKILVAKPGLDGHDRGAKIISLALRDAGMDVIYSGLHRSIDQIIATAAKEAVDIIGLSIMTGAHLTISAKLIKKMKSEGLGDTRVVVGGFIPKTDIEKLKQIGVDKIFVNGTSFKEIIDGLNSLV